MKADFEVFLFWSYIVVLGIASWVGPSILRRDRSPRGVARYRRYGYAFAFCFGFIPVLTGDWPWAIVAIPAAEFVVHYWILGRNDFP